MTFSQHLFFLGGINVLIVLQHDAVHIPIQAKQGMIEKYEK